MGTGNEQEGERRRQRTSVDRRQFLKWASAMGLSIGAASLASACQSPPAPAAPTAAPSGGTGAQPTVAAPAVAKPTAASAPTAGTPKRGGSFKVPVVSTVIPWPPIGQQANLTVTKSMFSALVRYSPVDWSPTPDLAEKWEVSKDGLTWTFNLRKGVMWHDGKPFTADDVKFSIETYADAKVNSILRGNFAPISRVDVVDANTVKMTTKEPYSSLIELLGYLALIMPKHLLEGQEFTPTKYPDEYLKKPIGTGAFKFGEHVPGDHFTVVANENYYGGKPYLDQVVYKIIKDANSAISQVKTGELDIAYPAYAQLKDLEGSPNLTIAERGIMDYRFLGMNYKEPKVGKFFADRKVRQAMAYAINSKGILDQVTLGKADRSNGPLPPALKGWYVKDAPIFEYNPEKAKQMLADAGFKKGADGVLEKDGQKLTFVINTEQGQPERQGMSLIFQQSLKDVGMDPKIELLDGPRFLDAYRVSMDFQAMASLYVVPATPDQHTYWQTSASLNNWGYSNPEVDKLFDEALKVFETDKRQEIYKKLYTILAEDQPVNFVYHPHELQAINKRVKGWPETNWRDALNYLSQVWLDS